MIKFSTIIKNIFVWFNEYRSRWPIKHIKCVPWHCPPKHCGLTLLPTPAASRRALFGPGESARMLDSSALAPSGAKGTSGLRHPAPSLRGITWRNKGRSAWNGSRFEHICAFTWRLQTFTGWNWKCHVIIVIKTDLSGFVVPMHSGLCEQYVKSLGLRPRDLTSCFARALVHWDNKPL